MTSCQGQILKVFQIVSSGSDGEGSANGWHYPVIRSQMDGWKKSIGDPEAPTQGLSEGWWQNQFTKMFTMFL